MLQKEGCLMDGRIRDILILSLTTLAILCVCCLLTLI